MQYVQLKFHSKYYHNINTYSLKVIVTNGERLLLLIFYQTFQLILILLIYGQFHGQIHNEIYLYDY